MAQFDDWRSKHLDSLLEASGEDASTWQMHAAADVIAGLRAIHTELQELRRDVDEIRDRVQDLDESSGQP